METRVRSRPRLESSDRALDLFSRPRPVDQAVFLLEYGRKRRLRVVLWLRRELVEARECFAQQFGPDLGKSLHQRGRCFGFADRGGGLQQDWASVERWLDE